MEEDFAGADDVEAGGETAECFGVGGLVEKDAVNGVYGDCGCGIGEEVEDSGCAEDCTSGGDAATIEGGYGDYCGTGGEDGDLARVVDGGYALVAALP